MKEEKSSLFQEAENESAYLKCSIQGFSGAGKSYTAMLIAIGLHDFIKAKKPVFYADTETGSSFLLPKFKEAKVELLTMKSRAFVDLLKAVDEAEKNASILIIDSISHYWSEILKAFQEKMEVKRLLFHHWLPIKAEWAQFTDKFINSNIHIIMAGRAAFEYSYEDDEEGVKELIKTGTKLRAETQMAYEPSLMLEMEMVKQERRIGSPYLNRCWVLKDRFDTINSKCFDSPKFEDFLPHIEKLNLGGKHTGVDLTKSSKDLFTKKDSASNIYKRKQILMEELHDEMDLKYGGRDTFSKQERIRILKTFFGTSSTKGIEQLDIKKLEKGLEEVKKIKIEKEEKEEK